MIGAYEHIAKLKEMDLITSEKSGRTRLLKLTPKFYDYFDVAEEGLKEKFKNLEEKYGKEVRVAPFTNLQEEKSKEETKSSEEINSEEQIKEEENEAFLLEPKKDEIFLGNENKSFHLKENLREKKTNNEEIKDGVNEET